jgi:hypothetical protein
MRFIRDFRSSGEAALLEATVVELKFLYSASKKNATRERKYALQGL